MPEDNACLGLCFFDHQLFYAVSNPKQSAYLTRIGAVNFNFDVAQAVLSGQSDHLPGLHNTVLDLKDRYEVKNVRVLMYPSMECWSILPKLVYDDASEREAHINILMNGLSRKKIHPAWHALSNENFKLIRLRTDSTLSGMQSLTADISSVDLVSAFEIGEDWIKHARPGGSFLTVGCFKNCISVSSFILGKLRGATYITFEDPDDLPYFWLQKARELSWMQGLHEQIQVYGRQAYHFIEILQPFWDDAGTVSKMNTLDKMQVTADEDTYGFDLELAYPAIMLALD
ncbi:MAG: hypothetical protein JXR26_00130 [Balneolaceae bacterium]|nr:hypothetical protein [Balneolaceae bacterium]